MKKLLAMLLLLNVLILSACTKEQNGINSQNEVSNENITISNSNESEETNIFTQVYTLSGINYEDIEIPESSLLFPAGIDDNVKLSLIEPINIHIDSIWDTTEFVNRMKEHYSEEEFEIIYQSILPPIVNEISDFNISVYPFEDNAYTVQLCFGNDNEWILSFNIIITNDNTFTYTDAFSVSRRLYLLPSSIEAIYINSINETVQEYWNADIFIQHENFNEGEQNYPPSNISAPNIENIDDFRIIYDGMKYAYFIQIEFGDNNEWIMYIGVQVFQDHYELGPYISFTKNV